MALCNALQHSHCKPLQHTRVALVFSYWQHAAAHYWTAAHCNTLQRTATARWWKWLGATITSLGSPNVLANIPFMCLMSRGTVMNASPHTQECIVWHRQGSLNLSVSFAKARCEPEFVILFCKSALPAWICSFLLQKRPAYLNVWVASAKVPCHPECVCLFCKSALPTCICRSLLQKRPANLYL